jgi:ANTAR domain
LSQIAVAAICPVRPPALDFLRQCRRGESSVGTTNGDRTQMAQHGWEFATELEACLCEGLPALHSIASEMGAASVSVLLVKNGRSLQVLYAWPKPGNPYADLPLDGALADAFENTVGSVPECSPIARHLNMALQAGCGSYSLFSWGTQRCHAIVAFGFTGPSAAGALPAGHIPPAVKLTSVATWAVYEVFRLRSELAIVNERLGKRKLIERAKGLLQLEHGLDEQQAYEHLRRLSRQRRMRMSDIAKDLLGTSHLP